MPKAGERFNPYRLFRGLFIPEAVAKCREISSGTKVSYGRLIRYARERGYCWPKQDALAADLGIHERQARRYLQELQSAGLIRREFQGIGLPKRYVFLWAPIFEPTLFDTPSSPVESDRSTRSEMAAPSGHNPPDKEDRARVVEITADLAALRWFPDSAAGQAAVSRLILRLVDSIDQARWLIAEMLDQYDEWPGPKTLQEIFEGKFRPRPEQRDSTPDWMKRMAAGLPPDKDNEEAESEECHSAGDTSPRWLACAGRARL